MWNDVRLAVRLLTRNRSFAFVAAATLGCGIGAAISAFAVVNTLTRGLPVNRPDQIVQVGPQIDGKGVRASMRELTSWRQARSLADIGASALAVMTVSGEGRSPEPFTGAFVSSSAFSLLGEQPILGRRFRPEEDIAGPHRVVMLGGAIWRSRFDSDPQIVGRTLRINDERATVVGVMREGFRFPMVADVWMPLSAMPGYGKDPDARNLDGFARLSSTTTSAQAAVELSALVARAETDLPTAARAAHVAVTPYTGDDRSLDPFFKGLLCSVAFVLLIGCVNVAHLLFARSSYRSRETAIRLAHGASQWRVMRYVLIEGAILAFISGAVGFALADVFMNVIASSLAGINFPYWIRWTMDARVYGFGVAVSVIAALAAAVWPAAAIARTSMRNVAGALTSGARSTVATRGRTRLGASLLALEIAFTFVLLAGAGLMARSFLAVYRADSVIDASTIVSTRIAAPTQTPSEFFRELEDRLRAMPTVTATATASAIPFAGAGRRDFTIVERADASRMNASWVAVSSTYFDVTNVSIRRGRVFNDRDGSPGNEAAIVNERFAAMYFPGEDPIGKRIVPDASLGQPANAPITIVGVSPSVRQQPTLSISDVDPVVFVPRTTGATAWLMVRTASNADAIIPLIRSEIFALLPTLALGRIVPLEETLSQSRWPVRVFTAMMIGFGWIALVLAAVGLYAVTASTVAERTQEIGVRMALGADRGDITRLFANRHMLPLGIGLSAGLVGALGLGPMLKSFPVQTQPNDAAALIAAAIALIVVAAAAIVLPARRASRLDAAKTLRAS